MTQQQFDNTVADLQNKIRRMEETTMVLQIESAKTQETLKGFAKQLSIFEQLVLNKPKA